MELTYEAALALLGANKTTAWDSIAASASVHVSFTSNLQMDKSIVPLIFHEIYA